MPYRDEWDITGKKSTPKPPTTSWVQEAVIRAIMTVLYGALMATAYVLLGFQFTAILALVLILANDASRPPTRDMSELIRGWLSHEKAEMKAEVKAEVKDEVKTEVKAEVEAEMKRRDTEK